MGNLIRICLTGFSALLTLLISYMIFTPMINDTLYNLVTDALVGSTGTSLEVNVGALLLTANIIVMGIKVFSLFIVFAIFVRTFIMSGYLTEEQQAGVY